MVLRTGGSRFDYHTKQGALYSPNPSNQDAKASCNGILNVVVRVSSSQQTHFEKIESLTGAEKGNLFMMMMDIENVI